MHGIPLAMKIFLIGFMGSGKTSVGKRVAKSLGYKFIDLDKVIESEAGISINEIFDQFGEEHFRTLEKNSLDKLVDSTNTVISTGGGTPCYQNNMHMMNANGITVYLQLNEETLFQRLKDAKVQRPLIKNHSDEELKTFIKDKLKERLPFYSEAQHKVDAQHVSNAVEKISELSRKENLL